MKRTGTKPIWDPCGDGNRNLSKPVNREQSKAALPDTLINPHFSAFKLMNTWHCSALSQEDIINIKE